ncbi:MAG TPA: ribosome biogenesis GTPase YlqF, partial [Clostridiales bacterium]|nr:ribosome biogenesis GTPase YlqF [Clostridiales bacterium]
MKNIQWFPGHMSKSMREISENAKLIDGVIYVLDARAPFSCINFKLNGIFNSKPIVYALNKSDLVESVDLKRLLSEFKNKSMTAVSVTGTDKKTVSNALRVLKTQLAEKIERYKLKGNRPLRVMVIGIPNTGKSTIINTLCGQKKAVTGDKAGVTKNTQWLK